MKEIVLEIITPSKSAYKGNVKSVTVPGSMGNFQVLYNHAPLLSSLEIGKIKVEDVTGLLIEYATSGGTIEVNNNKVLILADSVETIEEIDVDRAKKAYDRAKERLSNRTKSDVDTVRAEMALQRAINRMKMTGTSF